MSRTQIRGNTQILNGSIENAQISAAAAIDTSKLAEGVDFLKRDGSVDITGDLNLAGFKITGAGDGTNPTDLVNLSQLEAAASGLAPLLAVRLASTSNVDLAVGGLLTLDGIALAAADRVLVKDQTDASENGIYTAQVGAWVRATDADQDGELKGGSHTFVNEGSTHSGSGWNVVHSGDIVVGTHDVVWSKFSGSGTVVAGDGLGKVGNTLSVNAGDGVEIITDNVQIKLDGSTLTVGPGGVKLADLSDGNILIGNGSNQATSQTLSGDASILNDGTLAISAGAIDDGKIAAGANIGTGKLADGDEFLQRDGSVAWTGDQSAGGFKLTGIGVGVAGTDAVSVTQLSTATGGIQSELDGTQAGAGLGVTGDYTPDAGSNYITSSEFISAGYAESLHGADRLLDAKAKDLQDQITAIGTGNIVAIQSEVDGIETAVGLATDGSFISPSGSNYVDGATSVMSGLSILDGQAKINSDAIASTDGAIGGIQSELDATQSGAGLGTDGAFVPYSGTSFIDSATALANAISLLDTGVQSALTAKLDDSQLVDDDTFASASVSNVPSALSVKTYVEARLSTLERMEVDDEDITSQINGSATVFTLAHTPFNGDKVKLFHNGQRLRQGAGNDFTISGLTITLTFVPESGDQMWADYYYVA